MAFQVGNYVKSAALTGLQKGINKSLGTSGSFLGNSIGGLLGGVSQSLFEVGNAFNTISSVTSLKLDSVVAGGETGFVSGKCPERNATGDLEAGNVRQGIGQSMDDYMINTDPTGTIKKNSAFVKNDNNYHPLAWSSDKYFMTIRVFDYERKDLFRKAQNSEKYTVTLPLPTELSDSQRTEYSTADMKTVGTLMTEGMTEGAGVQAVLTAGPAVAGKIAGGVGGMLSGNKILGPVMSAAGAGMDAAGLTSENLVNAIEQYMGVSPNPQPSVLFKGPSLREFNFTWQFNPRDVDESVRIRKVIEKLKASALPRKTFSGASTGVLRYPQVCMLNFFPWDGSANVNSIYGWGEKSIVRIKRCFISNITSNYAPNGVPSFFAGTVGAPVFIQLSMTLKEIEFFTSEDWLSYEASEVGGSSIDLNKVFGGSIIGGLTQGAANLTGADSLIKRLTE